MLVINRLILASKDLRLIKIYLPFIAQTIASAIPVFPLVGSIRVSPGFINPYCSA